MSVPACLGVPLVGPSTSTSQPAVLWGDAVYGLSEIFGHDNGACLRPEGWTAADFVKTWNGTTQACKLEQKRDGISTSCSQFSSPDVATIATAQYVHFTSDLLAESSEDEVVMTVAHELAHYYRAHTSPLNIAHYDFWYDKDPTAPLRPVPTAEAEQLVTEYKKFANPVHASVAPAVVSKSDRSPGLFIAQYL